MSNKKQNNKAYDLLVDIGNTNVHIGFVSGAKKQITNIVTVNIKNGTSYKKIKKDIRQIIGKRKIIAAYICSVCPHTLNAISRSFKAAKINVKILGRDIALDIKNRYKKPSQVGMDRLVNAVAAVEHYRLPAVIIDFGTAVTIDIVSKKREYLGGCILAGLRMSARTLYKNTALLPNVKVKSTRRYFGRDTKESIISGIVWGYAGACNTIVTNFRKVLGIEPTVILTGGDSKFMKNFFPKSYIVDRVLTLKGINIARLS